MPVFNLESSLTIVEAASMQQSMLNLFSSTFGVILDGSEVEQVDAAGIQLLAVIMKKAAERQIEIRWSGASDQLCSAAAQLGLDDLLSLAGNS